MSIPVTITLITAGSDTGPFNLYSNTDGFNTAFEVNIDTNTLLLGYLSTLVPDNTTTIRVKSENVSCTNYIDLPISGTIISTPTPTPIVTPTPTPTPNPLSYASISVKRRYTSPSTITGVTVNGYSISGITYPILNHVDQTGTTDHFDTSSEIIVWVSTPQDGYSITVTDGQGNASCQEVASTTTVYTFDSIWIQATNNVVVYYYGDVCGTY